MTLNLFCLAEIKVFSQSTRTASDRALNFGVCSSLRGSDTNLVVRDPDGFPKLKSL